MARAGFVLVDQHVELYSVLSAIHASGAVIPDRAMARRQVARARREREWFEAWLKQATRSERIRGLSVEDMPTFYQSLGYGLFNRWVGERVPTSSYSPIVPGPRLTSPQSDTGTVKA
jgi:hypothetical protein